MGKLDKVSAGNPESGENNSSQESTQENRVDEIEEDVSDTGNTIEDDLQRRAARYEASKASRAKKPNAFAGFINRFGSILRPTQGSDDIDKAA